MVEGDIVASTPSVGLGRGRKVAFLVLAGVVGAVALVFLNVAGFMLLYYGPGVVDGQTCDLLHQPWCTQGRGMPQYVATAVVVAVVIALLVYAAGWRRHRAYWLACVLAIAAPFVAGTDPFLGLPAWWFM